MRLMLRWPLFLTTLYRARLPPHAARFCIRATRLYIIVVFMNRLGFFVSRGVVEHGVHLILQYRDIGRFRDVDRARALGSQRLATKVKSLIGGFWRHVDQVGRVDSSTNKQGSRGGRSRGASPGC